MADPTDSTTSTVISLPGAGPYAGKRSHKAKLAQRRDRELLLALIDEHQKWIEKHQQAIALSNARIGELLSDLRELDGYRTHEWELKEPWAVG
jgi:hypothetical protein